MMKYAKCSIVNYTYPMATYWLRDKYPDEKFTNTKNNVINLTMVLRPHVVAYRAEYGIIFGFEI